MKGPTKKQQELLIAIHEYTEANKRAPSYRELMEILRLKSPASIWRFVNALKKKGLIEAPTHQWRSVELKQLSQSTNQSIPIIGAVSKDRTPELYAKAEEWPMASGILPESGHFYALRIKDSSFLHEFLLPGDIIVVEATQDIEHGELVLASTKETIIGHFFDEGEIIRFRSNPYSQMYTQTPQIKVFAEGVQVWGVIVFVFRASGKTRAIG